MDELKKVVSEPGSHGQRNTCFGEMGPSFLSVCMYVCVHVYIQGM